MSLNNCRPKPSQILCEHIGRCADFTISKAFMKPIIWKYTANEFVVIERV